MTRRVPRLARRAFPLLALTACRDGVEPFRPEPFQPAEGAVVQLTFSVGEDLNPIWAAGDTVVYATASFPGLPGGAGVIARLPAGGGTAVRVFPELQDAGLPRWFATPALASQGDRLAFVELVGVATTALVVGDEPCAVPEPVLDSAVLRVRPLQRTNAPDAQIPLKFPGRDPDQKATNPGPYELTLFPFQRAFNEERALLFRPSWSPDGTRIVFSDGVRLLIWDVGDAATTEVPNTTDGVSPAWSPDGQLIAFTRLVRGASTQSSCLVQIGRATQTHVRTGFDRGASVLTLIRPDGSGRVELGEGVEPAWTPDGQSLYFMRQRRLFRATRDGSGATEIANTMFGRSPAVSPDGRAIVFARLRNGVGPHDLWLVRLP